MKEIFKKQKRNIVIKITAVLFAVWLIVSVVFSATIITLEKEKLLNEEHDNFNSLISNIENNGYHLVDTYVSFKKEWYAYIIKDIDKEKPEISCGADGYLDDTLQIVVLKVNENESYSKIIDTDESVLINEYRCTDTNSQDHKLSIGGNLVYDRFMQSITGEQLDSISEYLYTKKDKDGNYYELICKHFYLDEESNSILPKTVEIVRTNENNTWYAQDEVVESYELSPLFTDDLTMYTCASDYRNVIPGQFVLGTFKSDNLIEADTSIERYAYLDAEYIKTAPFTYVYKNSQRVHTVSYSSEDILYGTADSNVYYYTIDQSANPDLIINYARTIDILECCGNTLIIGVCALFLFFLIIGLILSIMMCKVIKTQLSEEEKRREVTNALAHDIKTPLFIISGYAQNLKENVNSEKREHYADKIIERTNEVNELVHKMLDFTRLERLDSDIVKEPVDLYLLTKEISEKFSDSKIENEIRINKNGDSVIAGNRELLTRALTNLLENAVRYSDENTPVIIEINERTISVSNTCSSITQEDIKHLTQPYYRGEKNRQSKGNGLGLSIVKSIVDIHNFTLDITLKDNVITFMIKSK